MRSRLVAAALLALTSCKDSSGPACTITGVTMANGAVQMRVGDAIDIPATVASSNCGTRLPALEYASAQPSVASVSAGGTVTALSVGSTTITAKLVGRNDQATATVTVSGRVLTIALRPTAPSVAVTGTLQMSADLTTDPGTPTTVRWVSSNPSRATISSTGLVTGVAAGTTTITAIADADTSRRASATLTVIPRVTGLQVAPGSTTLRVTETGQLNAIVAGDSGVVTAVTWQSASPAIATVDGSGRVTAIAAGQVTVTATSSADTGRRATASITVLPRVSAVSVSPSTPSVLIASNVQLAVTVTGDPGVTQTATWRSANAAIATISGTGLVTGVSAGQVVMTATSTQDTTKSATATITVLPRVSGVTIAPAAVQGLLVGASRTITAVVAGDSGVSQAVTWVSSHPARVTISSSGLLTGIAEGTATVTARSVADTTKVATATVQVVARVTSVTVSPTPTTVNVGATRQLTATVAGDAGVSQAVTWTTSNAAVATVSATGSVIGIAAGQVTITARSVADPTRSGTASVTVNQSLAALDCMLGADANVDFGAEGTAAPSLSVCLNTVLSLPIGFEISLGVKDVTGAVVAATFSMPNSPVGSLMQANATTGRFLGSAPGTVTITAVTARGTVSWTGSVQGYGGENQRVIPVKPARSPASRVQAPRS